MRKPFVYFISYLAVPTEWQILGIVRNVVIIIIFLDHFVHFFFLLLALAVRAGLLALHILLGGRPLLRQDLDESERGKMINFDRLKMEWPREMLLVDLSFEQSHLLVLFSILVLVLGAILSLTLSEQRRTDLAQLLVLGSE